MALFFLVSFHDFFKTWNYIADGNRHVCLCIQRIFRFRKKIKNPQEDDKHVGNPGWRRGAKPPYKFFCPPGNGFGHNLKILNIVQTI